MKRTIPPRFRPRPGSSRLAWFGRAGLTLAALAGLALAPEAQTSPTGANYGGNRGPDEDGGTVPARLQTPTGIHFVGSLRSLLDVVESARGTGRVQALSLDPSDPNAPVLLSFSGDFDLRLDRVALARGDVDVFFGTDEGFGSATLQLFLGARAGTPTAFAAGSLLRLPLGQIYAPGEDPVRLGLRALGSSGERYESRASADASTVRLVLRHESRQGVQTPGATRR